MTKYIASGLLIFSHVFLVGMELEVKSPKARSSSKDKQLVNNYVECTRKLGVYAKNGEREAFKHAWSFHKIVREYELELNVIKKDQNTSQLDTAIEWYKKSYDTEKNIKKHIDKLTAQVFEIKDGEMLLMLCRGRKLAVPHVKTKDLFESLWVMQNADLVFKYHEGYGYEDKPKKPEWIIKHCKKQEFITALMDNNYITRNIES